MKILFVSLRNSAEFLPENDLEISAGSLNDISSGATEVKLVLPAYKSYLIEAEIHEKHGSETFLGREKKAIHYYTGFWRGVEVIFIKPLDGFKADSIRELGIEQFIIFCKACAQIPAFFESPADIIHLFGWKTALTAPFIRKFFKDNSLYRKTKILFSCEDISEVDLFGPDKFRLTGLDWNEYTPDTMEFWGKFSPVKGGIVYSDRIFVSGSGRITDLLSTTYGHGYDGVFRSRINDIIPIPPCIKQSDWDPSTDRFLPENYSSGNSEGKKQCKAALLQEVSLKDGEKPLIALFLEKSRHQEDILQSSMEYLNALQINYIICTEGKSQDRAIENLTQNSSSVKSLYFDDEKSQKKIYSGTDCCVFLMPDDKRLLHLKAMRYGALPISRKGGAFVDNIIPHDEDPEKANGFFYQDFISTNIVKLFRHISNISYRNGKEIHQLKKNAMNYDSSYKRNVTEYLRAVNNVISPKNG
ncbi:MAG: glycogen synthase [Fibrobacterota bacterium]